MLRSLNQPGKPRAQLLPPLIPAPGLGVGVWAGFTIINGAQKHFSPQGSSQPRVEGAGFDL